MKIKCIRLCDALGREVDFSPWLMLGRIYHVMSMEIDPGRGCSYGIVTSERKGEWPDFGAHRAECFEIVSTVVPSNWKLKVRENGAISVAPAAWQESGFFEAFSDRDISVYSTFVRERDVILKEDS